MNCELAKLEEELRIALEDSLQKHEKQMKVDLVERRKRREERWAKLREELMAEKKPDRWSAKE